MSLSEEAEVKFCENLTPENLSRHFSVALYFNPIRGSGETVPNEE
jgi:hypothetical protein